MSDNIKLAISIIIDTIGALSNFIPFLGGLFDLVFAPIQTLWILIAYKTLPGAILGGVEELLPFADLIPSATIIHFLKAREDAKDEKKTRGVVTKTTMQ